MPSALFASFGWLWSLGCKFFRVAPIPTLFVIPATLVSQISMLLAFLLPLKVLILLGSDGMPRYLAHLPLKVDRDTLILGLCVATPGFYLLHLTMEQMVRWASNRGAKRLLSQGQKVILFENQDDIAASSYRRYADALANTVFIICVWITLGILFPPMCYLLVGYTAFWIITLGISYKVSELLRQRIEDGLLPLVRILTGLGFMLAFLLLVLHFLSGAAQGFLLAIVSLILSRLAFQRSNQVVSAISNLYINRRKLNALFFTEHTLSQIDEKQLKFWSLFVPETRPTWLRQLLLEQLAIDPATLDDKWHQTGASQVVGLEVEAYDSGNELIGRYLVRIYGKSPSLPASHEATLLLDDSGTHLPSLPLLAAGQVGKWPCHIFSLPEGCTTAAPAKYANHYLSSLMAFEPPEDLAARYVRSHPLLWQRLDATGIERLNMAADEETRPLVRGLEQQLPNMLETVRNLPLMLVNPSINSNTLLVDAEEQLWITDWGRWSLEPLGSGWPTTPESVDNLPETLLAASHQRPALQSVKASDVTLAALLYQFDNLCTRQLYLDALALLPELLEAEPAYQAPEEPKESKLQ